MLENVYVDPPKISTIYLIVTEQCNLRCTYCYEKHGTRRMTEEVAKSAVDFLIEQRDQDSLHITFFGGEPTLEWRLIANTMRYAIRKGEAVDVRFNFGMVTNCTSLPEEFAKEIEDITRDYSFGVQLSIDGPEKIQDAYRILPNGSGSWHLVEPTLQKWKELDEVAPKLSVSVHGCVNKRTLPHLFETYLHFRESVGVRKLWYMAVSEEDWTHDDVELYRSELSKIKDYIINRCEKEKSLSEVKNYAPLDKCLLNRSSRGKPCGAGLDFLSVTPDGTLSPCHQLHFNTPEAKCGDIYEGVDQERRRIFIEYGDDDFSCSEKKCPHMHCYRCIANNFDNRGNFFAIPSKMHCELSMVDYQIQSELAEYCKRREGSEPFSE